MTVVIHPGSHCVLKDPSATHMTSLALILLLNFVFILVFAFSLNRNRHENIKFVGHLSTRIWSVELSSGPYDPCTFTDQLSCLTIWSLESRNF